MSSDDDIENEVSAFACLQVEHCPRLVTPIIRQQLLIDIAAVRVAFTGESLLLF